MTTTKSAGPNDPERYHDCGNFSSIDEDARKLLCSNCPGWRRHHEPWRSIDLAETLDNMRQEVERSMTDADASPEPRVALIRALERYAHLGGWRIHRDEVHADNDQYRNGLRDASTIDREDDYRAFGFPTLLLVSGSRETDARIGSYENNWSGARPGGMLAIWVQTIRFRVLSQKEIAWRSSLASTGAETYVWKISDLPDAVKRLTGRDLFPAVEVAS